MVVKGKARKCFQHVFPGKRHTCSEGFRRQRRRRKGTRQVVKLHLHFPAAHGIRKKFMLGNMNIINGSGKVSNKQNAKTFIFREKKLEKLYRGWIPTARESEIYVCFCLFQCSAIFERAWPPCAESYATWGNHSLVIRPRDLREN